MITLLYSSIINYKIVYKPILIKNYIKSDNNKEDDNMFFTNCQYQGDKHQCNRHKKVSYTS